MLPEPEYYSLADAAEWAKCTVNHLVHLGATARLPVYVVPHESWRLSRAEYVRKSERLAAAHFLCNMTVYKLGVAWSGFIPSACIVELLLLVDPQFLKGFEAYPETATIDTFSCGVRDLKFPEESWVLPFNPGDGDSDSFTMINRPEEDPIKLKDCYLVVRPDDLKEVMGLTTKGTSTIDSGSTPPESQQEVGTDDANESEPSTPTISARDRGKMETQEQYEDWISRAKKIKKEFPKLSKPDITKRVADAVNKEFGTNIAAKTVYNNILGKF